VRWLVVCDLCHAVDDLNVMMMMMIHVERRYRASMPTHAVSPIFLGLIPPYTELLGLQPGARKGSVHGCTILPRIVQIWFGDLQIAPDHKSDSYCLKSLCVDPDG
jgi:hypothetical protein